jgi:hypothetical protein
LLPDTVSLLLDRHDQRLAARREPWRQHTTAARTFRTACERVAAAVPSAERGRYRDGLEL